MYAIIEVKFFVCRNCDSAFGNLCHFATANQESMFASTSPIPILGYNMSCNHNMFSVFVAFWSKICGVTCYKLRHVKKVIENLK
ncbi:hypothetical protein ANAPC5_00513 [Anaplasma phagocytophilum]|nr:hypothetical protein ANAPC2_00820 [Anaplasma phagocytophilum]SBO32106.1 hypothetical protein ANAPC3_00751 [Anaplasma phagocytophilum]SBO32296.1 hypothetical protein ANAPC4_00765 [Anaplasma phagocytophilum]SCV63262.1 hypothetical protein ANAPC5_00513 [Anaplasma phagocytophilum]